MKRKMFVRVVFISMVATAPISCGYQDFSEEETDVPHENTETDQQSFTLADQAWWRNLSQMERNQVILDRTSRDIGVYVGVNCKLWTQRVVAEASRGVVSVPTTYPDAYGWTWNYSPYAVRVYADIRTVQPGWIVQMNRWNTSGGVTPHTAIVVGRSSYGLYWVDSNYAVVPDNVVRLHSESFTDFEHATFIYGTYRYSMYYVSGG